MKFGTSNISGMPISILMSKIIFIKYLLPVPKLLPKLKVLIIYLKFGTVDISNMPISILMPKIIFMKYLSIARPKLVPKLKESGNY